MATQTALPLNRETPQRLRVRQWAWATLIFFVIVVLEGAIVRATSSGAGCGPHWPLCNGEILPHHPRIATMIEFAHRSLTGISTVMFVILVGWTFAATPQKHPARKAAVLSAILLLTEGALGAALVLRGWVENNISTGRVIAQSIHFTNTMLLLAATAATAVLLRDRPRTQILPSSLRAPALLAMLAILLTGATGSLAALADTVFPSATLRDALLADFAPNSPLLIRMRWMHPVASLLTAAATIYLVLALRRLQSNRTANLLAVNLLAQIAIGVADVLLLAPTWIQVLHLLGADIFWISLVALVTPLLCATTPRTIPPADAPLPEAT